MDRRFSCTLGLTITICVLTIALIWVDPSGFAAMATLYAAPESGPLGGECLLWVEVRSCERLPVIAGEMSSSHRLVYRYRWRPEATVGVVAFSELAYLGDSLHGGGGLGLRIRMPPQPFNTIRIDVGYGDAGWNVLFGVEEFISFLDFGFALSCLCTMI